MKPLQLYTYQTPNGHKAAIMLEEVGLPYEVTVVDIEAGAQHDPAFVALSPNNKIPVIVDPDRDRVVIESGAILHYLAERSGKLLPRTERERSDTLAWCFFQAAHVGPTLGQLWHFKIFANEKLPSVIARFEREAVRVFGVLDRALNDRAHIAGDAYGMADIMTWPWINAGVEKLGLSLSATPALERWFTSVGERPAVRAGLAVPSVAE